MADARQRWVITACLLLAAALLIGATAPGFRTQWVTETLHPAPALTAVRHLSDYNPALAGTPGDTEIYEFAGTDTGGTLLVLGGTHATEIAGVMTAVLLVESLDVSAGRVLVVPRANASAATHTQPGEAHPPFITIVTRSGPRRFRYGARCTNPLHQRPDPPVFRHPASPRPLAGEEARNLNRVYPGLADGTLTERVAWAIIRLIVDERVDLAFDLHEAPPERDLANTIVASEASADLAAAATIALQLDGWDFRLESSAAGFRGLSHREWTDATDTRPILMETTNPVQGRLRGRTTAELAVSGRDPCYGVAAAHGLLAIPYDGRQTRLETRIARNLAALGAILEAYNAEARGAPIRMGGYPDAVRLQAEGLGAFLGAP